MASSKDALMASLMGDMPSTAAPEDNGLFGAEILPSKEATPEAPPTTTTNNPSKLMQSGLLGGLAGGGGGGLFDEVDEQEAANQKAEEARRLQEQQQMNDQMQNMNLGAPPQQQSGQQFMAGYNSMSAQQQQPLSPQMQQQQPAPMQQQPPQMQQQQLPPQNLQANTQQPPQMQNIQQPQMQGQEPQMSMMQQPFQTPSGMMGNPMGNNNNNMNQSIMMGQAGNMMNQSIMMGQAQQQPPGHVMNQSMMMAPSPPQTQGVSNQSMMGQPQPQQTQMNQPTMQQQPGHMMNQSMMAQSSMQQQPGPMMNQSMLGQPGMYPQGPAPMRMGNTTAGMHNPNPGQGRPPQLRHHDVPPAPTQYGAVTVEQPVLLAGKSTFLVKSNPYWSYQVATQVAGAVWIVRRRFRDVVALEDRLRQDCPGAILPPRPDKHATRALEEATTQQSQEFAVQRAHELQTYFQQLVRHPFASQTATLRFFLSLQDELGTAWPEVSSNALTRLANAGVEAAVKTAEQWTPEMDSEDNAELLALYSAESVRMGAVLQAVPKLEGSLALVQEFSELAGTAGMEMSRWLKPSADTTTEGLEIAAGGLLRSGRRSKRLALELSAAASCFSQQYKLCRYERLAFGDRRSALQRRAKERKNNNSMMHYGYPDMAGQEADEIGRRLLSEVSRIGMDRRQEWAGSLKILAASFKEAAAERAAIWEATLTQFDQQYPGYYQPPAPPQPAAPDAP